MTAPRAREPSGPLSPPDRRPPRRGGGSSPSPYICAASAAGWPAGPARLCGARRGLVRSARALAAAALLALCGALALPATAQADVLVSNIEQSVNTFNQLDALSDDQSLRFTTGGTTSDSYNIDSVEIRIDDFRVATGTVSVYSDNSEVPGTSLFTFDNPTAGITARAINTFTAPANTTLTGGTSYHIVVSATSAPDANTPRFELVRTFSDGEDAEGEDDWAIDNFGYSGSTRSAATMMLRVNGSAVSGGTLSTDATLSALSLGAGVTVSQSGNAYTASVANSVDKVTVAPATNHTGANFVYLTASDNMLPDADTGTAGHQVALDVGDTVFKVKVTAEDGTTTQTYTVTVTRAGASDTAPVWSATMTAGNTQVGHGYDATNAPDTPAIGGLDADGNFDYGSTSYQVLAIDVATNNVVRFVVSPIELASDETLTLEFGGHALPFSDRIAAVSILGSVIWAVPAALDDLENEFPVGSTATVCLRTATQTCPAGLIVTPSKPTLSIAAANGREDGDVTFTATLSAVAEEDVTATWTASIGSGDTAVAADLGTTKTGTVTVPMGELTGTFDVPTADDSTDEEDETFTVTLSGVSTNATLGTATATGTIRDDDQPVASMADAAPVIEGGAASFTLTLSPASARELQLTYSVASLTTDTAVEEVDFPYVEEKVTFAAGEVSKTITVATTDDPYDEDAETFTVTVFSALVAFEGGTPFLEATGTINDNDDPPTLSVDDVSAGEGGDLTFTVELSAESEREVSVAWAAAARDAEGDDAEEGADFAAASGTLTFAPRTHAIDRFADLTTTTPGETARTFTVSTTDDAVDEADETFTVTLSNPTNASIPDATAKGTITSDDTPAVTGVTVTSVPALETDTYGAGETIEVAVDFSAPVNAAAGTDLVLSVGGAERAALLRGSGTQTLVFGYTVQPGDEDDDGIWMGDQDRTLAGNRNGTPQNGAITSVATGLDAVLDHDAPGRQSGHKVDGTRSIVSVEVTSTPALTSPGETTPDTYGVGEKIRFTVTFNTAVDVAGDPVFRFALGSSDVDAALDSGADATGTDALVFAYTVLSSDEDDNGIYLRDEQDFDNPDGPVRLDSDDTIRFAGTTTDVPLYWQGRGNQSGHKVDGSLRADNSPPTFDAFQVSFTVSENSTAGTTVVLKIAATDADDDTLTYSLEGTDAASFAIDSATGQITTATNLDYEVKDSYSMTAKIEDGFGGSDTVRVSISVTDVEEQSDTPAKPALAKVTGSSTSLAATWAEPGLNGGPAIAGYNLAYRVSPDGDWTDFAHTGTAVTATVTGLTADTDYQVRVQALNDETPSVWSDPSDAVRTNRVNNPPSFTTSALPDVAENVSAAGTVEAVDGDAGDDVTGYAIAGGADRALFEIGATDGVLSFATAPNFEDPKDQDADNTYEVTVEAASGAGDREATATRTFTVTVADVEEQSDTPAAPTLAAVTDSTTTLTATWSEPGLNGGPAIAGYNVQYRERPDGGWTDFMHSGAGTTATLIGLTANTQYQVRVQALNGETPSEWSSASSTERTTAGPPVLTSAVVRRDSQGRSIRIQFDQALDAPNRSQLRSAFSATADGNQMDITRIGQVPGSDDLFDLSVSTPYIFQGQPVVLSYDRSAAGSDALANDDGTEVEDFTTGAGGVPAVVNLSTRVPQLLTFPAAAGDEDEGVEFTIGLTDPRPCGGGGHLDGDHRERRHGGRGGPRRGDAVVRDGDDREGRGGGQVHGADRGRRGGRGGRDLHGDAVEPDQRADIEPVVEGHDSRRRRSADAERGRRLGARRRRPDFHGDARAGERQAGDGGLGGRLQRRGRRHHGGRRLGLHGGFGDADLRGERHGGDVHGVDDRGRDRRERRDLHGDVLERVERDAADPPDGAGHDYRR